MTLSDLEQCVVDLKKEVQKFKELFYIEYSEVQRLNSFADSLLKRAKKEDSMELIHCKNRVESLERVVEKLLGEDKGKEEVKE